MSRILIEVCTGSLEDSITASEAGADRIELNSSIELGGLSTSTGILLTVMEHTRIPVITMVRPHPGGFVYTENEKTAMLSDIDTFLSLGAAGIAVGALTANGEVDTVFVSEVRKHVGECDFVFHRAFDLLPDLLKSASILKDLGVDRILTSGGSGTAWEGRDTLRDLINYFGDNLEILPGSGISSNNAAALVEYTGCDQIHGSFSIKVTNPESYAAVLPLQGVKICSSEVRKTVLQQSRKI
ncbi:MAG: copper homeostasis protein CutC [Candidatus Sabulitectum sp.]|nr:copper homeostasis protein CutC [Candidatus Sabulitectum sp.]